MTEPRGVTDDAHQPSVGSAGEGGYEALGAPAAGADTKRALAVVLGSVLLVGVAVVKPWQPPDAPLSPALADTVTATAPAVTPAPSPSPAASAEPQRAAPPLPPMPVLAMNIEYRNAWGIRAMAGPSALRELWVAAPLPLREGAPTLEGAPVRLLFVPWSERPVRLLGLTTPVGVSIGDVEIAVARQVPGSDRVEFRPVEATAWLGRTLLWTLPDDGDWSPGIYQFRMEAGDTTTSLAVAIMTGPLR